MEGSRLEGFLSKPKGGCALPVASLSMFCDKSKAHDLEKQDVRWFCGGCSSPYEKAG